MNECGWFNWAWPRIGLPPLEVTWTLSSEPITVQNVPKWLAPKWTLTPLGMLMYDNKPVADMRYKAAQDQTGFILTALNYMEEKR
jgi:hypothetical protein